MALKEIAINIKATGVEQTAAGFKAVEGSAESMGRKVTNVTRQIGSDLPTANKALDGSASATSRAASELDRMERSASSMGNSMHSHAQKAYMGMSQLEMGIMSATMRVMNLTMAAALIAAPFVAAFVAIKAGISVIDDFQVSVIQIAAQLTQMQGPKNVAKSFQDSMVYARALVDELEKIDADSFANSKGLEAMLQTMTMQGVVLDINNKKQVESFTSLSNAVAMYTAGQDQAVQSRQEMRALMSGEVNQHSQLSRIIDSQIKQEGIYQGGLKEVVRLGRLHGDTLERLAPYLVGINAASESINTTWSAASSSMETAVNKITREGFAEVFKDVVPMVRELASWLKEGHGISEAMTKTWLATKGVLGPIWDILSMIIKGLDMTVAGSLQLFLNLFGGCNLQIKSMWEVFQFVLNGIAFAASVLLPTLIDKIVESVTVASGLIVVATSFGSVMLSAITAVASAMSEIGKGLWDGLTGDVEGMSRHFANVFSGAIKDGFQSEVAVFRGTLEALGDDWDRLKSTAKMDERLDGFFDAGRAKGVTAGTAPTGGKPPFDEEAAKQLEKYTSAMEGFKKQIRDTNPYLDEHEKKLEDVDAAISNAIGVWPEHEKVLRAVGEEIKANINLSKQMKDAISATSQEFQLYLAAQENQPTQGNQAGEMNLRWEEELKLLKSLQPSAAADALNEQIAMFERLLSDIPEKSDKVAVAIAKLKKEFASTSGLTDLLRDNLDIRDSITIDKASYWEQETLAAEKSYARQMELEEAKLAAMMQGSDLEAAQIERMRLLEEKHIEWSKKAEADRWKSNASATANALGQIGDALMQGNRDQFEAGKAMMMGQAIIAAALAIVQCYAQLGPIGGTIAAVGVGVATLAQISAIEATEYQPRALGGPVVAGGSYLVGEQGPELIRMGSAGTVIPNNALAMAGEAQLRATRENTKAISRLSEGFHEIAGGMKSAVLTADGSGRVPGVGVDKVPNATWWESYSGSMKYLATLGSQIGTAINTPGRFISDYGRAAFNGGANWGLGNMVFGSGKYTVNSAGLEMGYDGGVTARGYSTETKKGGWFSKSKSRTSYSEVDVELLQYFDDFAKKIALSLNTAGQALGGLTLDLDSVALAATKLDLRGMSNDQANKAIEDWFSTLAVAMATKLGGPEAQAQLAAVTRFGETSYEALMRVTMALQTMQEAAISTGGVVLDSSIATGDLASSMIEAFGGIDKFASAIDKYNKVVNSADKYDAIKTAAAHREIAAALAQFNIEAPTTIDAYRSLVENTNPTSPMYRSLIDLADAFGTIGDAATAIAEKAAALSKVTTDLNNDLTIREYKLAGNPEAGRFEMLLSQEAELADLREQGVTDLTRLAKVQADELAAYDLEAARQMKDALLASMQTATDAMLSQLKRIYSEASSAAMANINAQIEIANAALDGAKAAASAYRQYADELTGTLRSLAVGDTVSPENKLLKTRLEYDKTANLALTGDQQALSQLSRAATEYLDASRAYNASGVAYQQAVSSVTDTLTRAQEFSDTKATEAERQVELQTTMVDLLQSMKDNLSATDPNIALLTQQNHALDVLNGYISGVTPGVLSANAADTALIKSATGGGTANSLVTLTYQMNSLLGILANSYRDQKAAEVEALAAAYSAAKTTADSKDAVVASAAATYTSTYAAFTAAQDAFVAAQSVYNANNARNTQLGVDYQNKLAELSTASQVVSAAQAQFATDYSNWFYNGGTKPDLAALTALEDIEAVLRAQATTLYQQWNAVSAQLPGDKALMDSRSAAWQSAYNVYGMANNAYLIALNEQTAASVALAEALNSWNAAKASYANIPAFASGGLYGGGSALVGEHGPELIDSSPGYVYRADETRNLFALADRGARAANNYRPGPNDGEVLAELKEQNRLLRELLVEEKAGNRIGQAGFGRLIVQGEESNKNSREQTSTARRAKAA